MTKALYPGSFDPVTNGHLDIIERASKRFSHLYIGIIDNMQKESMFDTKQRVTLLEKAVGHLPNVSVVTFSGLSVDCAQKNGATALIRGLRAISDFEYELQLASTNRRIDASVDTLFLMAKTEFSYVSSSLVKELSAYDADVSFYVPKCVEQALKSFQKEKRT